MEILIGLFAAFIGYIIYKLYDDKKTKEAYKKYQDDLNKKD